MLPLSRPTARCDPITCTSVVLLVKAVPDLFALELVVLVAPMRNRGAKRLERPVEPLGARAERQRVTPRRQLQNAAFDDRNAVFRVVVAVAAAGVALLAGPCQRQPLRSRSATASSDTAPSGVSKSSERRPPPPKLTANLPLPS